MNIVSSNLGFKKELRSYGVSVKDYKDTRDARGETYTTRDDGYPPTPFISPINPFNVEILASKNVLEIGCGVGRNLPFVMEQTQAHYYGVDPNTKMTDHFWNVQDSKYKSRVTLCKTFEDLPKDVKFDFVISTFVFQHIGYRPSSLAFNVTDITLAAMQHTYSGTVWFVLEHEREEVWQYRWLYECKITPAVYFKPGGNHAGGGILPYPEFECMTARGNDNNIIIFREVK